MSLQRIMPWLITLLVVTILAMMISARAEQTSATSAFAAAFALTVVAVSWRTNAGHWAATSPAGGPSLEPIHAARRNARLTSLTYAWAALGMLGLYTTPLTGLRWQHGWQYAAAFGLLSVAALAYTHLSGSSNPAMRQRLQRLAGPLSAAQATLAAAGLAFLVMTGTLQSGRLDCKVQAAGLGRQRHLPVRDIDDHDHHGRGATHPRPPDPRRGLTGLSCS